MCVAWQSKLKKSCKSTKKPSTPPYRKETFS